MDNLSCHKTAEVARLIAGARAAVRYLPPYSPNLNPIERMFSKLKGSSGRPRLRTIEGLIAAMGDILGWFRHSGYETPRSSDTLDKEPL